MGRLFEILNRKWNQAYYKEFNLRIKQSRKKTKTDVSSLRVVHYNYKHPELPLII